MWNCHSILSNEVMSFLMAENTYYFPFRTSCLFCYGPISCEYKHFQVAVQSISRYQTSRSSDRIHLMDFNHSQVFISSDVKCIFALNLHTNSHFGCENSFSIFI